jgi:hypothetical protein
VKPKAFPPELLAWASTSGFDSSPPILHQAMVIVRWWARKPLVAKRLVFPLPEKPDFDSFLPVVAEPAESLEAFLARAKEHYFARRQRSGRSSKKGHVTRVHFEWLARRIFKNEEDAEIAAGADHPVTSEGVRKGIESAARALQLTLPKRRAGRRWPKGQTASKT